MVPIMTYVTHVEGVYRMKNTIFDASQILERRYEQTQRESLATAIGSPKIDGK
jgi:hypothetical protein